MAVLSDETLMAYVDGELDAAGCARVEADAERNADVRARIERFRSTGLQALKPPHDAIAALPVPQFLLDTVAAAGPRAGSGTTKFKPTLVSASAHPERGSRVSVLRRPVGWQPALAYAASIALAVGWFSYATLAPGGQILVQEGGRILASGVLARALETAHSKAAEKSGFLQQTATATPQLSFKDRSQHFCREYEVVLPSQEAFAGVGCRLDNGRWLVQAHVPTQARSTGQVARPAAGAAAVQKLIEETMVGDALGPDEESKALSKGWR